MPQEGQPVPKEVWCHRTPDWLERRGKDPSEACGHRWTYKGKSRFIATCPKCNTSVTIKSSDERLARERKAEADKVPSVVVIQLRAKMGA